MPLPSTLERCRMALAEIGGDPADVFMHNGKVSTPCWMPIVQRWQMWSTAAWPKAAMCLPCFEESVAVQQGVVGVERAAAVQAVFEACRADLPFQRSTCGVL